MQLVFIRGRNQAALEHTRNDEMTTSTDRGTEPFLTTEQIAEFLGKPASWVHNNAGRLGMPRVRLGNQWRYRRAAVVEWLERQGR
jgi:excisionase family DNA binding protein